MQNLRDLLNFPIELIKRANTFDNIGEECWKCYTEYLEPGAFNWEITYFSTPSPDGRVAVSTKYEINVPNQ